MKASPICARRILYLLDYKEYIVPGVHEIKSHTMWINIPAAK